MVLKGILVDFDNFLYDYAPCNEAGNEACFSRISERHGIATKDVQQLFEEARKAVKSRIPTQAASHSRLLYFKATIEKIAARNGERPNYGGCVELEELFWKTYMERMKVYPNVTDFLSRCEKKGVKVAIVSDQTTQIQLEKTKRLGLNGKFEVLVTSEEVGAEKPDPRIFEEALRQLDLSPSDVVMLGDDEKRDKGAEKIGIRTIIAKLPQFWEKKEYLALFL